MIDEKDICELFSSILPSGRDNGCFESDAEIIRLPETPNGLFTTDEFSAEDLFREEEPYLLGWNIASGAISDILACGGSPRYYAHALTVPRRWDATYLLGFAQGVRDVLMATGTRFIGGDCGCSEVWRCTVSVIGLCGGPPVRRRGAARGDSIYLSGKVGAGNLEAALRLNQACEREMAREVRTQFPVRVRESAAMRRYAACCIDTSDGLAAALNTLADLNSCGYEVSNLPYLDAGKTFCRRLSLPRTLLALGECGEYELLFTVKPSCEQGLLEEAKKTDCAFYRIGTITGEGRVLTQDGARLDLGSWNRQARSFPSVEVYLDSLVTWLERAGICRRNGGG